MMDEEKDETTPFLGEGGRAKGKKSSIGFFVVIASTILFICFLALVAYTDLSKGQAVSEHKKNTTLLKH